MLKEVVDGEDKKKKKRQKQESQSKVNSNTLGKSRKANSKEMGILELKHF